MQLPMLVLWLVLLTLGGVVDCHAADSLLGPVEELSVLDGFATNSSGLWTAKSGGNVDFKLAFGRAIPGVVDSALEIDFAKKNPGETAPGQNWFALQRQLPPGSLGQNEDGIRLLMGAPAGGQWWIRVELRVGGETYQHVIEPIYPPRATTEHLVPFAEFSSAGHPLTREKASRVDGLGFSLSANGPSIYLEKITTYRQQAYYSWLKLETTHATNNIFEPGQQVLASLTPGGAVPGSAKAFRYEVTDFFQQVAMAGKRALAGTASYQMDLTPKKSGFYEVRAYWLNAAGKDIENRSCLLSEGTLPPGLQTFAVMPRTVAQNIESFKANGTNAFFGLHGDFMGLADLMGLSWRLDYTRWGFLEPNRPDRSKGVAPWAAESLAHEPARPPYQLAILPLCGNFAPPDWARNKSAKATPYANWEDYAAMLRDYVAVKKHLYPHMKPRIYGVAWEVNLNMPPDNFWPPYTPADVVELHRRTCETIKQADPDAIMLGPCSSNLSPDWFEALFKAGVLEYVDGIETHGYSNGTFFPEDNDYPGKLEKLRQLMRQYHHGRALPIYVTEAAFRGMLGSQIVYRTQAQVMTRLAIILKGEGVKVFLPFYGIDYDRDGWWGFCFNSEMNDNPWATRRISPKPTVNAMATCAGVLEAAVPVKRVQNLGTGVWAYLFQRDGTRILAVWTPGKETTIHLRVGTFEKVRVLDIMGENGEQRIKAGVLDLVVGASPKYVIGVGATVD